MIEIRFAPPFPPWSLNQERSKHWSWKAKRIKAWRTACYLAARELTPGSQPPSNVTVELPVKGGGRRDPSNFLPGVKAAIDGLVDAGLWNDDTAATVTVIEPVLVRGGTEVVVRVTDR